MTAKTPIGVMVMSLIFGSLWSDGFVNFVDYFNLNRITAVSEQCLCGKSLERDPGGISRTDSFGSD